MFVCYLLLVIFLFVGYWLLFILLFVGYWLRVIFLFVCYWLLVIFLFVCFLLFVIFLFVSYLLLLICLFVGYCLLFTCLCVEVYNHSSSYLRYCITNNNNWTRNHITYLYTRKPVVYIRAFITKYNCVIETLFFFYYNKYVYIFCLLVNDC